MPSIFYSGGDQQDYYLSQFNTSQRALLELEDELVRSTGQVSSNLASLYKALGGG